MGRYTTVQAYADNNPSMRTVLYNQTAAAASTTTTTTNSSTNNPNNPTTTTKKSSIQTEKVDNPYGSTAGAGSGEFHTYRHSRAREMLRMQELDRCEDEENAESAWSTKLEDWKVDDERKMLKRKKKRERGKTAKMRKKILKANGVDLMGEDRSKRTGEEEEEFDYTPIFETKNDDGSSASMEQQQERPKSEGQNSKPVAATAGDDDDQTPNDDNNGANETRRTTGSAVAAPPSFSNDGSFMELMKQQMAVAAAQTTVTTTSSWLVLQKETVCA